MRLSMCNESHFRVANYKDLFQTGQSFLTLLEKFPAPKAFFVELHTIPSQLSRSARSDTPARSVVAGDFRA